MELFPREYESCYNIHHAKMLPSLIRFGSSSWTYEGWKGHLYFEKYTKANFAKNSLQEYAKFPWFRTVGIDSFFYRPPSVSTLRDYAAMLPPDFIWVAKAYEGITSPVIRNEETHQSSTVNNPNFLNPHRFNDQVLNAYSAANIGITIGPTVFQFPHLPHAMISSGQFIEALDRFFSELPTNYQYAVEIRNPELLSNSYFAALNRHKVAHCFNHWTNMPDPELQMRHAAAAGGLTADFYIARFLTPLGITYQSAVKTFQPFDQIKAIASTARNAALRLAKRSLSQNKPVFIIVNNRLEGHSPATIAEMGRLIVDQQ
jgi:uncharacterized protein YecE (DUF72 family)